MKKYKIFNFNTMGLMSDDIIVTAKTPKMAVQTVYPQFNVKRDTSWTMVDVICTDMQNFRRYGYALYKKGE